MICVMAVAPTRQWLTHMCHASVTCRGIHAYPLAGLACVLQDAIGTTVDEGGWQPDLSNLDHVADALLCLLISPAL